MGEGSVAQPGLPSKRKVQGVLNGCRSDAGCGSFVGMSGASLSDSEILSARATEGLQLLEKGCGKT